MYRVRAEGKGGLSPQLANDFMRGLAVFFLVVGIVGAVAKGDWRAFASSLGMAMGSAMGAYAWERANGRWP